MKNVQKNRVPFLFAILLVGLVFAGWYYSNFHMTDFVSVTTIEDDSGNDKDIVATVNDIPVHSNKVVASTVGTKVIFTDKSSVDLATCEIDNKGYGYITLDSSMMDDCQIVTRKHLYSASSILVIEDVMADINVVVCDGKIVICREKSMRVVLTGPKKLVERILLREENHRLLVNGSAMNSDVQAVFFGGHLESYGFSTSRARGLANASSTSVISSDSMIFATRESAHKAALQITVYVPVYTGINIAGEVGNMSIGDTHGVFSAEVQGNGTIHAGAMQMVDIEAAENTHVIVASTMSSLRVEAKDNSWVEVSDGDVYRATLIANNSSHITFGGKATDAYLESSDTSIVTIKKVTNTPIIIKDDDSGEITFSHQ